MLYLAFALFRISSTKAESVLFSSSFSIGSKCVTLNASSWISSGITASSPKTMLNGVCISSICIMSHLFNKGCVSSLRFLILHRVEVCDPQCFSLNFIWCYGFILENHAKRGFPCFFLPWSSLVAQVTDGSSSIQLVFSCSSHFLIRSTITILMTST